MNEDAVREGINFILPDGVPHKEISVIDVGPYHETQRAEEMSRFFDVQIDDLWRINSYVLVHPPGLTGLESMLEGVPFVDPVIHRATFNESLILQLEEQFGHEFYFDFALLSMYKAGMSDAEGNLVQLYWVMGRSANSQNRVIVHDEKTGIVRTEPADPAKVANPSLIIYNAMKCVNGNPHDYHVVSNGNQTDTIFEKLERRDLSYKSSGFSPNTAARLHDALAGIYCEPDAYIFTPRISGVLVTAVKQKKEGMGKVFLDENAYMSILKADQGAVDAWKAAETDSPDFRAGLDRNQFPTTRQTFQMPLHPGIGYCLTTYEPLNPERLFSFEGEPFPVKIDGETLEDAMNTFWFKLEDQWKVSIAGKKMHKDSGEYEFRVTNRYEQVR